MIGRTRIADFAQQERMSSLILQTQTQARLTQAQIGTGKVAEQFSGLGPNAERLVDVKNSLQETRQFLDGNLHTDRKLVAMEAITAELVDLATTTRTLAIQRSNDGSAIPGVIGQELEAVLDQAVALLNSDLEGRYLFGGSRTDQQPVVLDPAFDPSGADLGQPDTTYYQGDDLTLSVRADVNVEISHSLSADLEGFQEFIGGLRGLIAGDRLDDGNVIEASHALINESIGKIADYQAELGTRLSYLDRVNQRHTDTEVYLETRVSEIEDVDLTDAISKLAQDQVLLESALATIGRLNQLSLVDYL